MNSNLRKAIAIALCATTLSMTIPAGVIYAAEPVEETTVGTGVANILAGDTEPVVSKIPQGNAYVPQGTVLVVELTDEVTSKKAKEGDSMPLVLVDNLIINDVIVVPAGSTVEAVVTKARKAGGLGRSGKLEFQVNAVKSVNGVRIPLVASASKHTGSDGGAAAVFAAVSIVGGLFMKGKNVHYSKGDRFDATVAEDTDLKVKISDLATAMDLNKPHGVAITLK